jgi:site-specific DNA-methyltransferase (adenine-specific)
VALRVVREVTPYYQDEAVTLYLGDCREVLPQIEAVDHVITDPPYARDVYVRMDSLARQDSGTATRVGQGGRRVAKGGGIERMGAGDIGCIDEMLDDVADHVARLVRRWVVVFSDAETTWRWRTAIESRGLRYVRTGAWVKPDPMPQMTGDRPCVGFEPCTIGHADGSMRWNGGGRAAVWTHNTAKGGDRPDHPCPKPLPLMRDLVLDFTDPSDLILDPFAGSATTLRAAKILGRMAVGIERDEKFAAEAVQWLRRTHLDERYVRIQGKRGKQGAMDFGQSA